MKLEEIKCPEHIIAWAQDVIEKAESKSRDERNKDVEMIAKRVWEQANKHFQSETEVFIKNLVKKEH